MRYLIILILITTLGCSYFQRNNQPSIKDSIEVIDTTPLVDTAMAITENNLDTIEQYDYQNSPFLLVNKYPTIKDSATFIQALEENCHISQMFKHVKTINYFKKIKLFGSKKFYYLIEYDYHDGCSAEYPFKQQFLFDQNGYLKKILNAVRVDILNIFPQENSFLFVLFSTPKGNGSHFIYKINHDTAEQVYNGFLGYRPHTYSTGYFSFVNEPNELYHQFKDINQDGYNDLIFYGKVRYSKIDLGYQDKIVKVKYCFLYHPSSGHFIEQEDYSKKYEFIFGNTK